MPFRLPTVPALGLALLAACASPGSSPPPEPGRCVEFETLVPGTVYRVGDAIAEAGVEVRFTPFEWSSGALYQDGFVEVGIEGQAGGSGLDLVVNNVLLEFDVGRTELVEFSFAELGGNVNLRVNGDFRNIHNLSALNGKTVGGATLTVVNGFGNDSGTVRIAGVVETFAIGGQEFWLDEVCFTP